MKPISQFFRARPSAALPLAFLSAVLPACIDVTEEFWIHEDGKGRMKFEVGMAAPMAAIANAGASQFEDAQAKIRQDSNVETFDFREETRGDTTFYIMEATLKDISSMASALNESVKDKNISPGGKIGLTQLENGNYKFVQPLDFQKKDENSGDSGSAFAAGMMAAMFQGRHMTIRIHGNIVSTNGTIAEDGKSVEWKFPLTDAIAGRIDMKQAEAEISLGSGLQLDPKLLMITLGVIGTVVIATVAFLLGKKSRT